jgi:hypothetical protein
MEEQKKFNKLSNLVGDEFTVERVWGYKFKTWDPQQNKMLVSDEWRKDYQKKWDVDTDKGKLDLSASQMGNMLESVMHAGKADVVGATFSVKSNGKTGMEIRYWLNPVRTASSASQDSSGDWPEGF